jgi:hypothetical protein
MPDYFTSELVMSKPINLSTRHTIYGYLLSCDVLKCTLVYYITEYIRCNIALNNNSLTPQSPKGRPFSPTYTVPDIVTKHLGKVACLRWLVGIHNFKVARVGYEDLLRLRSVLFVEAEG